MSPLFRGLLPVLPAMGGAILVWIVAFPHGAGLTYDSVGYLSAAEAAMRGEGLFTYAGKPLVEQPPLYPLLVALVGRLSGLALTQAAVLLNGVLLGGTILGAWMLTMRLAPGAAPLALAVAIALPLSRPVFQPFLMAWSEPLFFFICLLFLVQFVGWIDEGRRRWLIGMALCAALASLTRYIGITLVATGLIGILWLSPSAGAAPRAVKSHLGGVFAGGRIRDALFFLAVSVAPPALWAARNYLLDDTLFGRRSPSAVGLAENLSLVFQTVANWFAIPAKPECPAGCLIVAAAFLLLAYGMRNEGRPRHSRGVAGVALFAAVYSGFLVVTASRVAYDPIGDRLLSPILPPLLALVAALVAHAGAWIGLGRGRRLVGAALALPCAVWMGSQGGVTIPWLEWIKESGIPSEYRLPVWQASETLAYLRVHSDLLSGCRVYSNGPDFLYLLAGVSSRTSLHRSPGDPDWPAKQRGVWPREGATGCLVWFDNPTRPMMYSPQELGGIAELEPWLRFGDGTLFRVRRWGVPSAEETTEATR